MHPPIQPEELEDGIHAFKGQNPVVLSVKRLVSLSLAIFEMDHMPVYLEGSTLMSFFRFKLTISCQSRTNFITLSRSCLQH
jgi:hypothetical protein